MSTSVRQFRPEASLAHCVDAFWLNPSDPRGIDKPVRVDPDGCIDLIFLAREGRNGLVAGKLFLNGGNRRAQTVTVAPNESFVGVRFRPGMSRTVLAADPADIVGDIHAAAFSRDFASLEERLSDTAAPEARLRLLAQAVRDNAWSDRARPAPARVQAALAMLGGAPSEAGIERIANAVGVSARSLRRDIVEWTGFTPNLLARIFRYQAALRALHEPAARTLTAVAAEAGYADHAHMTREFRDLSGCTPSQLRRAA